MNIELTLAHATANWNLGENNGDWCIKDSKGKFLFTLGPNHDMKTAMAELHKVRPFELSAFNLGINYGKDITKKENKTKLAVLEMDNIKLMKANQVLSEQLERHLNRE